MKKDMETSYYNLGLEALSKGQVAIIILAGG
jgi:hypothetical protein